MVVGKVPGHGSTVELGGFKVYLLLPTDPRWGWKVGDLSPKKDGKCRHCVFSWEGFAELFDLSFPVGYQPWILSSETWILGLGHQRGRRRSLSWTWLKFQIRRRPLGWLLGKATVTSGKKHELLGGFKHVFSISYMGCQPSHWRTPSFFKMISQPPTSESRLLALFQSSDHAVIIPVAQG